jgi:hypothetical protein
MKPLFKDSLSVINVGLAGFGEDIVAAGGSCVTLAWQPPAQGDRDAAWALATIFNDPLVERANAVAFGRFAEAQPVLIGIAPARDALAGMAQGRRIILHAGPPIAWPGSNGRPGGGCPSGPGRPPEPARSVLAGPAGDAFFAVPCPRDHRPVPAGGSPDPLSSPITAAPYYFRTAFELHKCGPVDLSLPAANAPCGRRRFRCIPHSKKNRCASLPEAARRRRSDGMGAPSQALSSVTVKVVRSPAGGPAPCPSPRSP